jgi:hypothetical protein
MTAVSNRQSGAILKDLLGLRCTIGAKDSSYSAAPARVQRIENG